MPPQLLGISGYRFHHPRGRHADDRSGDVRMAGVAGACVTPRS